MSANPSNHLEEQLRPQKGYGVALNRRKIALFHVHACLLLGLPDALGKEVSYVLIEDIKRLGS